MNTKLVGNFIGYILFLEAFFMLPAALIALLEQEQSSLFAFMITIAVSCVIGLLLSIVRPKNRSFYAREGFITVALAWIILSLAGALPYTLSGAIPNYVDALFEAISGFTTTGSTILTNVEAVPNSLLYWRSFTNWLGGMGIMVFMLAVIPLGRGNGEALHILRAESPGPSVGKLVPKMRDTARILYLIYIAMTVLELVLLLCGNMPFFDALTNTLSTAGTGGFCVKNASIGAYNSYYLQSVISIFMLLFGVNFNLYYLLILRDFRRVFRSEELRAYLGIVLFSVLAIALNTVHLFSSFGEALHHSFFQVSSIITTTGFATTDFNLWPEFSRCLLVLLMFFGACAGSTAGGMKISRILILMKSLRQNVHKMLHPRSVKAIKFEGATVDDTTIQGAHAYLVIYLIILACSTLIVAIDNFSMETTVTAVVTCLNNIGPGLDMVGPIGNFSAFSIPSKLILSLDMLFGRLELFPMLILFSPSVWKRNH